jgi:hypothetical protein
VSVWEQTSDATLSKRPLFSHRASADMDDSETLDAPIDHDTAECKSLAVDGFFDRGCEDSPNCCSMWLATSPSTLS